MQAAGAHALAAPLRADGDALGCKRRLPQPSRPSAPHPHPRPTAAGTARARPVLTSLPLQVFLYFGGWWDALFWLASLAVFIYKGSALPFPPGRFAAEFVFLWLWLLVEPSRLFLGARAPRAQQGGHSAACLVACAARLQTALRTVPATAAPHSTDTQTVGTQAPRATRRSSRARCCSACC